MSPWRAAESLLHLVRDRATGRDQLIEPGAEDVRVMAGGVAVLDIERLADGHANDMRQKHADLLIKHDRDPLSDSPTRARAEASRKKTTTFLMPFEPGDTTSVSCGGACPPTVQIACSLFTVYGFIAGGSPSNTNWPLSVAQPVPVEAAAAAGRAFGFACRQRTRKLPRPLPVSPTGPKSTSRLQPASMSQRWQQSLQNRVCLKVLFIASTRRHDHTSKLMTTVSTRWPAP